MTSPSRRMSQANNLFLIREFTYVNHSEFFERPFAVSSGNGSCVFLPRNVSGTGNRIRVSRASVTSSRNRSISLNSCWDGRQIPRSTSMAALPGCAGGSAIMQTTTVLIVEQDVLVRHSLAEYLREFGKVHRQGGGDECERNVHWAPCRTRPPEVLARLKGSENFFRSEGRSGSGCPRQPARL